MSGMTDKEVLISKVSLAIIECDRHILRIEEALGQLINIFPLTIEIYNTFDSEKIRATDQLLFRFGKFQDKIGASIIKSLCDLIENTKENTTFLDYLNIAEKYDILESAYSWEIIRTVRNSITHDYEDNIAYQVKTLNDVYDSYKELLKIFDNIKNKFGNIKNI